MWLHDLVKQSYGEGICDSVCMRFSRECVGACVAYVDAMHEYSETSK